MKFTRHDMKRYFFLTLRRFTGANAAASALVAVVDVVAAVEVITALVITIAAELDTATAIPPLTEPV